MENALAECRVPGLDLQGYCVPALAVVIGFG